MWGRCLIRKTDEAAGTRGSFVFFEKELPDYAFS